MNTKRLLAAAFALLWSMLLFGQDFGIRGKVLDRISSTALKDATIKVAKSDKGGSTFSKICYSGVDGTFYISVAEGGNGPYSIEISAAGYFTARLNIRIANDNSFDLGNITLSPEVSINTFDDETIEFEGANETGSGYEDIPSVLSSTQDVFESVASYNFSQMRYLSRGYESNYSDVYINGVKMNDAMSGYTPYSLFSGLNETTRDKESVIGLASSEYGVGGINGLTNINMYASSVPKGTRFSVLTNSTTYRFRLMGSYSTGMMDNGWAFSVSASTRLGGNDWVKGTFYQGFSYYLGAEKRIGDEHRFALTAFGAPVLRGAQNSSTQEVYDLVGSNYYNSNWGYQNGKVRNAKVRNNHEPVILFNYEYTPMDDLKVALGLSYRFGKNGYSSLDWYDAPDPRPDYYRNLPSYYEDDPVKAGWLADAWRTDPSVRQINWDRLYQVNRNGRFDSGVEYSEKFDINTTKRSKYILEERHADQNDFNINALVTKEFGSILKGQLGYSFRYNKTEYYKIVKDLLGGDYWFDVDQFAERDFGSGDSYQNNLLTPNRVVKQGEKYGYDYYANLRKNTLWTSWDLNVGGFQATLAAEGVYQSFWREGLYKKGLFPENSYGRSEKQNFLTYSAKLGLNYKFTSQNIIYANVGYMTQAPYFEEAFLSPRTRNSVVNGLTSEKIFSADINYSLKTSFIALRVSAFYTEIKDQTDLISFYDDIQRTFTNFSMTGIDQRNIGIEAAVKVPIIAGISFEGAVSYGNYVYTSNPLVTQTIDNSEKVVVQNEKVYWKGYKVARTPQLASSIGLNWRGPNYLFAGINFSYFDGIYISMNPLRRTDYAIKGIDASTQEGQDALMKMTSQEKFAPAFLLNANVGKSWSINRKYLLGLSVSVNNILNNKNIKTGGYEQMRLKSNKDTSGNVLNYTPFDSKYFYLYGINYMVNVYFRF